VFAISDKLASLLDEKKASRLTERLFDLADELKSAQRASRKRHHESEPKQEDKEVSKKAKMKPDMEPEVTTIPAPGNPSPGQLTTLQVKTAFIFNVISANFLCVLWLILQVVICSTFLLAFTVIEWKPCKAYFAVPQVG
jgi:hypothetical protein